MNTRFKAFPLLLLAFCHAAQADDYSLLYGRGTLYPPGCISGPLDEIDLSANHVARFFSQRIWLEVVHKIYSNDPKANLGEIQLDMYRVGCSEPGRSVILAEFSLSPVWIDPRKSQLLLPYLGGNGPMDPIPFAWQPEANAVGTIGSQSFFSSMALGDYTGGWSDPREFRWRYVLDVQSPGGGLGGVGYYNDHFSFLLYRGNGEHFYTISVPSTRTLLGSTGWLPLSGRLSGNWVEQGAPDQGFVISVNSTSNEYDWETEAGDIPLVVFVSWFTFDNNGEPLWLTGAATILQGASETELVIEAVEQGRFLGSGGAQRSVAGSARLRAVSCNRLQLEYDLESLGLGSGVLQLQRPGALEIADYTCRDYDSLKASMTTALNGPAQPQGLKP